jgi:hypothetical protein
MFVVGDEAVEVGTIPKGEYRKLETFKRDNCRVIFTLGEERNGWLGTEEIRLRDTIKIYDGLKVLEYEL